MVPFWQRASAEDGFGIKWPLGGWPLAVSPAFHKHFPNPDLPGSAPGSRQDSCPRGHFLAGPGERRESYPRHPPQSSLPCTFSISRRPAEWLLIIPISQVGQLRGPLPTELKSSPQRTPYFLSWGSLELIEPRSSRRSICWRYTSHVNPLVAVGPWASHVTSPHLSFLICEMG